MSTRPSLPGQIRTYWRLYPHRRRLLGVMALPFIFLLIALGIHLWHEHTLNGWQILMDQASEKKTKLSYYRNYDAYRDDPQSSYNDFKRRGLFIPLSRPNLLITLDTIGEGTDAKVGDVNVSSSQTSEEANQEVTTESTQVSMVVTAEDDRSLYDFMRGLEEEPSFIWQPESFTIEYNAPNFELNLTGVIVKFLPFAWR